MKSSDNIDFLKLKSLNYISKLQTYERIFTGLKTCENSSKYDLNIKIIKILFFEKLYHFSNIINNNKYWL